MIYYVDLTFTVSASDETEAIENAQLLSEEITSLLGIDNFVSEVHRR